MRVETVSVTAELTFCDKRGISAQAPESKQLHFTLPSDHLFPSEKHQRRNGALVVNQVNALICKNAPRFK